MHRLLELRCWPDGRWEDVRMKKERVVMNYGDRDS